MFLPTTRQELQQRGWDQLDVILVTGDAYIDSPHIGIAVVGHTLADVGYRVGVIAQPDIHSPDDITRLGEPALFWGVSGGSIDSMVANYTALKKPRRSDDYTPGGQNDRRPDRAVIVYTNLIKRYYKDTAPIVLGGLEASLRRVAHYDYWDDAIRRSVLLDAKADYLIYGMAEKSVVAFADAVRFGRSPRHLRGLCYVDDEPRSTSLELPPYEKVREDKQAFIEMFHTFYQNNDPRRAVRPADMLPDGDYWCSGVTTIRYSINHNSGPPGPSGAAQTHNANTILNSHHPGGVNGAMADGSVHFLSESMDLEILRRLAAKDDGQPVDEF